jgi:hypothetical protein
MTGIVCRHVLIVATRERSGAAIVICQSHRHRVMLSSWCVSCQSFGVEVPNYTARCSSIGCFRSADRRLLAGRVFGLVVMAPGHVYPTGFLLWVPPGVTQYDWIVLDGISIICCVIPAVGLVVAG